MLYRIYTEDLNRERIGDLATLRLPQGFTLLDGRGCWNGNCENSLVIEAAGDNIESAVTALAADIKRENHQQAVLVVSIPAESELI